ncbi:MAG: tetratricopeptide repeat protein, partial [Acidobacteriota bacterium]
LLYEMYAGRSPFRGKNGLHSLQMVLNEHPPPLRALRPEIPGPLSDLTEKLLHKDPRRRSQSAVEVSAELDRIESSQHVHGLGPPPLKRPAQNSGPILSEARTTSQPGGRLKLPTVAIADHPQVKQGAKRLRRWALGAILLATLLSAAVYFQHQPAPRRVVVLRPVLTEVENESRQSSSVAFACWQVLMDGMASLKGIEAFFPTGVDGISATPFESARAVAVDEALQTLLKCDAQDSCQVSILRLDGRQERRILQGAEPFPVATSPQYSLMLAKAVRGHLWNLYSDHRVQAATTELNADKQDYADYLALRRVIDKEGKATEEHLRQAKAILGRSRKFVSSYLLAAELARNLSRFPEALELIESASELAPEDPSVLRVRVRLLTRLNRLDDAKSALDELESLTPGSVRTLAERARLLRNQGELVEAARLWQEVVDQRPHWAHLWELANLEIYLGRSLDARRHVKQLQDQVPGNYYGQEALARLELFLGSLDEAEKIYSGLTQSQNPRVNDLISLGWARLLKGDSTRSMASYREALAIDQDYRLLWLLTRLSLATAERAAGLEEEASDRYRRLLLDLEAASELDDRETMIKAECLARLGQDSSTAVRLGQDTIRDLPQETDLNYQAALIHALVGEGSSALTFIKKLLDKERSLSWFQIPAFANVRALPEYQELTRNRKGTPK